MTTRIGITGAAGRMGRTLIEAIAASGDEIQLAAAIERPESSLVGADSGELVGQGRNGIAVVGSLEEVIAAPEQPVQPIHELESKSKP